MKNIKLKGAKNLRDLSTFTNIKEKLILRGPTLDNLNDKDINILVNDYNLKTIIDLRTERERDDRPDINIDNVTYYHMPIFKENTPGITHEDDDNLNRHKKIDMKKLYEEILAKPYLSNISKIIKKIISIDTGSIIYHCSEGKDRTGVISLILLMILDVDKSLILKDYLYTNKVNKKKANNIYFNLKYIKHINVSKEKINSVFLAKEEYINAVFNYIETNWKTKEDFFKNGLQLTDKEITKFKNKML